MFAIFTPGQKLPIGTISLNKRAIDSHQQDGASHAVWSTGTFIGSNWRRLGIGTEAKMLLLHWASLNLPPLDIYSSVLEFNQASLKTQQKCGYHKIPRPDHMSKRILYRNGRPWSEVWLRVKTGTEWLTEVWNPYAKENGFQDQIWNPDQV